VGRLASHSAALVLALAACALAGCFKQAQFKEFAPSQAPFKVMVPAMPAYQVNREPGDEGDLVVHMYNFTFDGVEYGVNYVELPAKANALIRAVPQKTVLDNQRDGLLKATGWKLESEQDVSLMSSIPGRSVTASIPGTQRNAEMRIFWAPTGFYQVGVILPQKPSYNQRLYADRFKDSFQLRL
jgi:hypothetical protein